MASLSIALPTITPPSNLVGVLSLRNVVLSWIPVTALIRHQIWRSTTTSLGDAVLYDTLAADVSTYTDAEVAVGTTYSYWVKSLDINGLASVAVGPATIEVTLVTSNDTSQLPPTSLGFGVGSGASSGSVTAYNTWQTAATGSFYVDAGQDAIVTISMIVRANTSSVSVPSGSYSTMIRSRLYDATVGADVPASIKTYVVYENLGIPAGQERCLWNINETYISGFRGLIVPGHDYILYGEVMKQRTSTATANVDIGGTVTSSGSSSI